MTSATEEESVPREDRAATGEAAATARKVEVKITEAKGRPMLTWVGKRPLSRVTAFPAQHVQTFDQSSSGSSPSPV